jgi:uncharacterized membrane protein
LHLSDGIDLFAGLLAVVLLALVDSGQSSVFRTVAALGFVCFVPGRAIVTNWPQIAQWSEAAVSMVLSLAVLTLLATVTLWVHVWQPLDVFQIEAWLSLVGLTIGFARRHRRLTDAVVQQGPRPGDQSP